MKRDGEGSNPPSRARMIFATFVVVVTVLTVWKVIDYRMQPPPPPPLPPVETR